MAEVPNTEPLPSSSENSVIASDCKDDEEPSPKKRKTALDSDQIEKLEHRLGGILCCAVCLDLPQAAVYQVFKTVDRQISVLSAVLFFTIL